MKSSLPLRGELPLNAAYADVPRSARCLHKLLSQIDHLDTLDDTMIARESTPCQANLGRWVVRLLKPGDLHIGQIARTVVFGQLNMLTNSGQAISTATEM